MSISTPPAVEPNGAGPSPEEQGWRLSAKGQYYIPAPTRRGNLYRVGEETVEEALSRDGQPRDRKPTRKPTKPGRKPPPPKSIDLREVEEILAEAFKSPAVACAALGDEWAADHFTNWGPYLARNLTRSAEHNAWLRKKLEKAATGGDVMMQMMTIVGLAGAVGMYALPPLVYWLNLPIPERGRLMLGVPERHASAPPAQSPPPPEPSEPS